MWFGTESGWAFATFFLVGAVAFYIQRIDQRVRLIKMQQHRLSLTFLKIENDLAAIQDSLLVMSRTQGDETEKVVAAIRLRRPDIFRLVVEQGPSGAEILRGLEFPDIDEDPKFWNGDLIKRLGLAKTDDTEIDQS
jgi:hypothetical protein